MRRYRKYALWGSAFAVLITLGAATAAVTAGAAGFGAQPAETDVNSVTNNGTGDADDRHPGHDQRHDRRHHDHDHDARLDVELKLEFDRHVIDVDRHHVH